MGVSAPTSAAVGSARTATAPSRRVVATISVIGALAAAALVVMAFGNGSLPAPGTSAFLACWLVVPYLVAGIIAWRLRPESHLGPLMVAAGFVSAANFLVWSGNDLLHTLGIATQFLPPILFLHVFLAFPSGLLESRSERVVVAAAYAAAGLTVPALVLGQDLERNVFAVFDRPGLADVVLNVQLVLVSLLSLAGIVLLVVRRLRHGPPLRVTLAYLVDSFALALLMIAVLLLAGFFEWTSVQEPIRLATFGAVGLAPIVFLAALLQARLGRASVGELLVDLGVNPGPAELQDALARALRDPSATLAYWLPEFGAYADVEGRQMDLDAMEGRSMTPVARDGAPVAMLLHDHALDDEPRLLQAVAVATGMVIQNAQLQVELRARLEELRGSRIRILEAEQRERQRLERDLHDGAQQRLIALSLELGALGERFPGDGELRRRLDFARQEVADSLAELRDLARGIHPATLSDHGLAVALESLATRAAVPVQVIGPPPGRLPAPTELAAFLLVCEALANVARHARASAVEVEVRRDAARLVVEVRDDGVGGASAERGTGLRGLADRVEALGGRLRMWSPPGGGTRLRAEIPCG